MNTVKCLVWDLDDTLWDGVVLEGDRPPPFEGAVRALETLDRRGVLHAVAGRGDRAASTAHLAALGLDTWFSEVEIGWGSKADAVRRIARSLGIPLDAVAFVDNDPAERSEVASALPQVRCYRADQVGGLASLAEFRPGPGTAEARGRRGLYRVERLRGDAERDFPGSRGDFLASLDLVMTVRRAGEEDLARARELTVRTHQLNTTGVTFDLPELRRLCRSPRHEVLVAALRDRFGSYGTIGLTVSELTGTDAVLLLLLTSCRVLSRGAGGALLEHLVGRALAAGLRPVAHFLPTPVNQAMLVTLRFAGFEVLEQDGERMVLAVDPARPRPARPGHVRVAFEEERTG
ncbi:HAD-IIIC family phosphatase [Streptomyces sp. LP11]|uniref:HAD-IIIC family phosphatase n=1 Tax=Streptomyces pyxinicus TaxID=2970331 RepID=A0ABT2B5T4_9ACTN|nr:HAD-IIIC family phosphatase [Streptomyces sp. LP11]MCS0603721.1 HAD-IIIC family phosphatase [Streptomyces sp. LP11]